MTLIGRFCEGFIEAGWLVAVMLAAAFLNPFSDQVFEPDKAALFRMLVVLMVAAWIAWGLDSGVLVVRRTPGDVQSHRTVARVSEVPIAGVALLLLLVYLVSTIASVSPRVSWWGSYQRMQGTYTFLAYLGLFFLVLSVLRRADQLHRLITVLLLTSFPVALYAILQHYGMSLLQFSEVGVETRVISTLGNAIFLAAYLAMVVPLTLWRILDAVGEFRRSPYQALSAGLVYSGLCLLQLGALVFTQSRGPLLGLLAELFVFVLLIALVRRRRRWAVAGVLVAAVPLAFILVLNVPSLPTEPLRRLPYVARFGELAGAGAQTVEARALAWDTVLEAVRAEPVRALVGYGPETMKSVLTRFMPAQLWVLQGGGQYGTFDRAHNAVFDALYAGGVAGALLYLLLYATVFYQALRWMGLVSTARQRSALIGLLAGGTGLGLIVPWLWPGDPALAAIGMPVGMLAGLVLFLLGRLLAMPTADEAADDSRLLLLSALLAAIIGHFVEVQTGIEIVATQSYFWLYTALLVLLGTGRIGKLQPMPAPQVQRKPGRGRGRRGRRRRADAGFGLEAEGMRSVVAMALVAAVLLGTLSYAFVHGFNVPGARGPAQALIGVTWFFGGLVVVLERPRLSYTISSPAGDALTYAITSLTFVLPFALYHRVNAQTLDHLNAAYLSFLVWLLLGVGGIALALQQRGPAPSAETQPMRLAVYVAVAALAFGVAWAVDVTRIRADIYEKVGKTAMQAGLSDQAIPNLQRAVTLQPKQDQYYVYLGGAYVEQAQLASDQATKDRWAEQARRVFEQGWLLAPRDSDHPRQLGVMYSAWAGWSQDPDMRRQRLEQSLKHYLAAVDLNPENPDLRLDLAGAYFVLGLYDQALAQYQHAVEIGSPGHLARAYAGLGDIHLLRGQLEEAAHAYRLAMEAGHDRRMVLESRMRAATDHPDEIRVRESLALVYAAMKRKSDALKELSAALELASNAAERAEVEKLIAIVKQ